MIHLVFAGDADGVVLLTAIPLGKADRLLTRSRAPILAMSLRTFDVPQVLVGERDAAGAVGPVVSRPLYALAESSTLNPAELAGAAS